jgi:hypothetical protein
MVHHISYQLRSFASQNPRSEAFCKRKPKHCLFISSWKAQCHQQQEGRIPDPGLLQATLPFQVSSDDPNSASTSLLIEPFSLRYFAV